MSKHINISALQVLDLKDQRVLGIIFLVLLFSVYLLSPNNVPLVSQIPNRNEKRPPLLELLKEGYRTSRFNVFKLRCSHGEQWVLPAKFLDELKSLPEHKYHKISLTKSLSDQFLGDSTYVGTHMFKPHFSDYL
ncbi:hypothetical protein VN97_g8032 [Penicillium thymicola]|uniref:Uncharacterized protein n=1 Tax=Penicillium thymicola TaxID=293382 RepID=A0AAI9TE02_PENTH|nr:hypothetical protein VN97_g8032 [Penicillium thymicola]